VLLLLAGCGSGGSQVPEDRQFASSAKTAPPGTITPTAPPTEPASRPSSSSGGASGHEAATPFSTRGAPNHAYILNDSTLTIVDVSTGEPVLTDVELAITPGEVVRDIAASPSGDRAAVLVSDARGTASSLRVTLYAKDGRQIAGPVGIAIPDATPVASPASPEARATPAASPATAGDGTGARLVSPSSALSWAPSGDRLVVTVAGRSVSILPIESRGIGAGQAIDIPTASGSVAGAWLSPRGDQLLLVLVDANGNRAIATRSLAGSDQRPHVLWPGTDERRTRSVRQAAWLPDGSGIVFTSTQQGASVPGTLSLLPLDTLRPRALATSGRAGPSARVGTFSISPDGKSVAYALETPADDGWSFHSLWVRSLRDGSSQEISSANGEVVDQPAWTSQGVLWTQENPDGTGAQMQFAGRDGVSVVIATWRGHTWESSTPPVASPIASPLATPATPGASPVT